MQSAFIVFTVSFSPTFLTLCPIRLARVHFFRSALQPQTIHPYISSTHPAQVWRNVHIYYPYLYFRLPHRYKLQYIMSCHSIPSPFPSKCPWIKSTGGSSPPITSNLKLIGVYPHI
ncbi:hypothetical protein M413DRAFT_136769 [Hebeloma cylindrosporum]|uniref:Uncharacterized protein n=1 Tax=Hebeloma cylindrosporum TaxID=76867 RepID=A0A0C2XVQ7_HEBCY|nr:hypothetical protein M413DRAFT_136769 [Hebeloma cylindrosporum h7]